MSSGKPPPPRSWRRQLEERLAGLEDRGARLIGASVVIQAALRDNGLNLVVVGGSALTIYRPDEYQSADIDFVGGGRDAEIDAVFREVLGFRREGRHWYDEDLQIALERPGVTLEPLGAAPVDVDLDAGEVVRVISIEDLILDRVAAWDATGSYADFEQAVMLDGHPLTEQTRLEERAHELDLSEALSVLRWLGEEQRAGRMTDELPECSRAHEGYQIGGLEEAKRSVEEYRAYPAQEQEAL